MKNSPTEKNYKATFLSHKRRVQIEKIVRHLQRQIWILAGKPRNYSTTLFSPKKVAEFLGYQYKEYEQLIDPENPGQTDIAGVIDPENNLILISQKFTKEIRLFTAAHEIGHAVLHPGGSYHRDRPKTGEQKFHRDLKEREADYFAACLLMPRKAVISTFVSIFGKSPMIIDDTTAFLLNRKNPSSIMSANKGSIEKYIASLSTLNGKSFESISAKFGVSSPAMAYRFEELNMITYNENLHEENTKNIPFYSAGIPDQNKPKQPLVKIGQLKPDAKKVNKVGGKSNTWKGKLNYSDGSQSIAFVKDIENQHLAKELLIAVLAKSIGLTIPQACLVSVEPKVLPETTRRKFIFGLEDAQSLPIRNKAKLAEAIMQWPLFLLCSVFDSWVGNDDRLPNNLLFGADGNFYLIDHGEALKINLTENMVTRNNLIDLYKEYNDLSPKLLLSHLIEESQYLYKIDFKKIKREIISANGEVSAEHIDPIIDFLKRRLKHLPEILDTQICQ